MSGRVQETLKSAHVQYVQALQGGSQSATESYRALERTVKPEVQWPQVCTATGFSLSLCLSVCLSLSSDLILFPGWRQRA